jgi:hypothetical protein
MNLKQLKKNVGKTVRLWPIPQYIPKTHTTFEPSTVKAQKFFETATPRLIPWQSNLFRMESFDEKEKYFLLTNSEYRLKLYPDCVIEYLSPDMLLLKIQYLIADPDVYRIPIIFYKNVNRPIHTHTSQWLKQP